MHRNRYLGFCLARYDGNDGSIWVFIEALNDLFQITESDAGEALDYKEAFDAF